MSTRYRKPSKPFVLKNIKPKEFQELLNRLGACETAREWAEKKSLKTVLKKCKNPSWLNWLLHKMTNPGEHYAALSAGYYTISAEEATAWGGQKRFERAEAHSEHAMEVAFNKNLGLDAGGKAGADVYRLYYTVE